MIRWSWCYFLCWHFLFLTVKFYRFCVGTRKNDGKWWVNERDSLLTCEEKAGMDFASLLCICQNTGGGRVAIGNVEVSFSLPALWPWARGVKHICMSVIASASLSANTDVVQTRKVHYHFCVTVYLSHSLTLSLTEPSLPARVHVRTHSSTLMVCFHSCFQCTASLECVCVCVSFRLRGSLPSITWG